MTNVPPAPEQRNGVKPPEPAARKARWLLPPVFRCREHSQGGAGVLEIANQPFLVLPLDLAGFRLSPLGSGRTLDIDTTAEPWVCDCGAGPCRHVAALQAALPQLFRRDTMPMPAPLNRFRSLGEAMRHAPELFPGPDDDGPRPAA
jgi:hypothetical protein